MATDFPALSDDHHLPLARHEQVEADTTVLTTCFCHAFGLHTGRQTSPPVTVLLVP